MKKIDWDGFKDDNEILRYLKRLPRYKNSAIKSALRRAIFFLCILYCRLFNLNKPLYIVLVTNNGCNLDCSYCYGEYGKRTDPDYSTKDLLKIIDEFKDLGTQFLALHGGESLLRKDLGEIINYAKHKGFYIGFNTNGYAVPKRIDEIRCVDTVSVSLDGRKEGNDKYRGEGCYDKAIDALNTLQQNNIPSTVIATLTRDTIDDVEFLAELARSRNLKIQYNILYDNPDLAQKHPEMTLKDKEIREVLARILDLKRKKYPVFWSENVLEEGVHWPFSYDEKFFLTRKDAEFEKYHKQLTPCYHAKLTFNLDADGRLVACWGQNNPNAPNIKEVGIPEALKRVQNETDCEHCTFLCYVEQNALFHLGPKTILNTAVNQLSDALKIGSK